MAGEAKRSERAGIPLQVEVRYRTPAPALESLLLKYLRDEADGESRRE